MAQTVTASMEATATMGKEDTAGQVGTPRKTRVARAGGTSMDRILCWAAIGISGLMALLFLYDLVVGGWPLYGASGTLDVFALLAAGVIIYVSVDTLRELR